MITVTLCSTPQFHRIRDKLFPVNIITPNLDELQKDQGLSGPKGLAPRDIQQIKTLYDAYKRDADIAMAQEARNMRRAQNRILNPPRFNPALTAAMDSGTIGG